MFTKRFNYSTHFKSSDYRNNFTRDLVKYFICTCVVEQLDSNPNDKCFNWNCINFFDYVSEEIEHNSNSETNDSYRDDLSENISEEMEHNNDSETNDSYKDESSDFFGRDGTQQW